MDSVSEMSHVMSAYCVVQTADAVPLSQNVLLDSAGGDLSG